MTINIANGVKTSRKKTTKVVADPTLGLIPAWATFKDGQLTGLYMSRSGARTAKAVLGSDEVGTVQKVVVSRVEV